MNEHEREFFEGTRFGRRELDLDALDGIEVTQEMVDAGHLVMEGLYLGDGVFDFSDNHIKQVYRAMELIRRSQGSSS
jgi:hypothetical protein